MEGRGGEGGEGKREGRRGDRREGRGGRREEAFLVMWPRRLSALNLPMFTGAIWRKARTENGCIRMYCGAPGCVIAAARRYA